MQQLVNYYLFPVIAVLYAITWIPVWTMCIHGIFFGPIKKEWASSVALDLLLIAPYVQSLGNFTVFCLLSSPFRGEIVHIFRRMSLSYKRAQRSNSDFLTSGELLGY